ncbi:aspartic peptidase domain-containing protein [Mycena crocata]|nr:aspartic peptidase domain-containing protein [Mycena crocata]
MSFSVPFVTQTTRVSPGCFPNWIRLMDITSWGLKLLLRAYIKSTTFEHDLPFFPTFQFFFLFSSMILAAALPSAFVFLLAQPLLAVANGRDQQPSRPSDSDIADDISNFSNNRYTATVSIGGQKINVSLDTGSTDLWLNPRGGVGSFESTGVTHEIHYGQGTTFINGTIGLAEMSIAGHTIPHQAFINVTMNHGLDECGGGICGLIGLGFDSPNKGIVKELSSAGLDGPKVGKSVLSSIFDMSPTPEKNRFFGLSLSRLGDEHDSADASLTIGEYEAEYTGVQWETKRPVFPATAEEWNILTDGVIVNGVEISWPTGDENTPAGKHIIGLDSGTPNIIMRPEIRDRIYSAVPGAVLTKNSSLHGGYWSADHDVWVVPCNTSIDFSAIFNGQPYPIHPLDLTRMYTKEKDGVKYTFCVGSITNGGTITSGRREALYGPTFLRNVYTVFSFGDKETSPYVQFLSRTNQWEAAQDFANVRKDLLAKYPPEIAPANLIRIFDGPSTSSGDSCSVRPSTTARVALVDGDSNTGSSSTLSKYAPIIIGLLVANLVIVLALLGLVVTTFIRRRRATGLGHPASLRPGYIPAKMRDDARSSFGDSVEDRPYADR